MACLEAEGLGGLDVVQHRVCEVRVRQNHLQGKIDVRLAGRGNPNSHGARPVYENHLDD